MSFKASVKFAGSLIFPKAEKKSSARSSLIGAITCIGLSLVPLIVVVSISTGMIEAMTERLIGLSTSHLQAYVASAIDEVATADKFMNYAASYTSEYDEILNTYPQVEISALASGKDYRTGIQIRGMQKDIFSANKAFSQLFQVEEGSFAAYEEDSKDKKAVICKKLAETLKLHEGDTFRVITTRTFNGNIAPKLTSFKVAAIVTSGYQELDSLWVFVPIETAYSSLSLSNASYTIMMETPDAFGPSLARIQRNLQSENGRIANFYRWDQVHESEFQNFSSTKVMLIFIMLLIVLVASVNVTSAIVMLVMERQKEIAILKSIGAKPSSITLSFLLTGGACGLSGVLLGLPIGIIFAWIFPKLITGLEALINWLYKIIYNLKGIPLDSQALIKILDPEYYIQNYSVSIDYGVVFAIGLLTVVLSVLVSIIPSIKAGKEKPLDILRKS